MHHLITDHLDIWTAAELPAKVGGRGRTANGNKSPHGIQKLRELILELAVRGKLVPLDSNVEPASELLKKISAEKSRLIKEGKIKKQKPLPVINEDEKPFDLPSGWEWSRLGDVTNYGVLDKAEPSDVVDETWVLELEDVEKVTSRLLQKVRFSERQSRSSKNRFSKNDVIYGKLRPYLDKVIIADEDGVCTTEMIPVRGYIAITPQYLRLVMKAPYFISYANDSTHGMNLPRMGTDKARLALFPIVSEAEQHRIVAKVDELMALCDQLEQEQTENSEAHQTLVETLLAALVRPASEESSGSEENAVTIFFDHFDTLFTTEQSIDQLKQTILQLAVMGKLVPQDPNDEPASELLKKIAAKKSRLIKEGKIKKQKLLPPIGEDEKPFDLPRGWEWVRVWDVSKMITSGSRDWAKFYSDDGAIFVTMGNLTRGDYKLRMDSIRYVQPPADGEGSRTKLEENDLLISITGDVGNLGLIPQGFGEAYINQHTCLLRFMPECQSRYFPELMRSPWAKYQFDAPQRGVKNSFRLSDVGEMTIPLPPLTEQNRIVAKVDELMAICDALKARLQEAQITQVYLADAIVEQAVG